MQNPQLFLRAIQGLLRYYETRSSIGENMLGRLFVFSINSIIVTTMAAMTFLTFRMINSAPSLIERNLRYLALAGGLLLYFAANTLEFDLASLIKISLTMNFPGSAFVAKFAIPSSAGFCSAWFLLRGLRDKATESKAIKFFVMLTAFLLFAFADLYVAGVNPEKKNDTLLANVSFVSALILYSVFMYDHEAARFGSRPRSTKRTRKWTNEV